MEKIIKKIALSIVALTFLCVWSAAVAYVSSGGKSLGRAGKMLLNFSEIPQKISKVLSSPEVAKTMPLIYYEVPKDFEAINQLDYDLYGTMALWDEVNGDWNINLLNLKSNKIEFSWDFAEANFKSAERLFKNSIPKNSLVLPDKSLIGRFSYTPNLFRLDSLSNVIWKNEDFLYHHSLQIGSEGNIWACGSTLDNNDKVFLGGTVQNLHGEVLSYRDDFIVQVDVQTGKTLFEKGVAELLIENGYSGYLYSGDLLDPIHLNDVQPILEDGQFWKQGDVLLSIRNRSLVILYRPATNKILRIISGPFINQHDADVLEDGVISIFNNNIITNKKFISENPIGKVDSLKSSEVLMYDFVSDSFSKLHNQVFVDHQIKTKTQGLSEVLKNGDLFVEEQNNGVIYIIRDGAIIYKHCFLVEDGKYCMHPSWMQLYQKLPY